MISENSFYIEGNWIVHKDYGIGQVIGKDKRKLDGEEKTYIKVKTADSTYWIPVAKIDFARIRPIASKKQIRYAFTLIRRPPRKLPRDFNLRRKEISQNLKTVSLYSCVRMMRDLNGRRKKSKLNESENYILKKLKEQFLDEYTMVMDKDRELLEKDMNKALSFSVQQVL